MKSLTVVFSALSLTVFAACSHLSSMHAPWNKCVAHTRINPPELDAFIDAATDAAKDITLADTISDWQMRYDKVKDLSDKLPEEGLNKAQQKECDGIVEQMEIGKLALEMKKVDAKTGMKQCKLVSAAISKHVEKIRTIADSPDHV
jgi:hypothetical protein